MSALASILLGAAGELAVPAIKEILGDKLGGAGGEIAGKVIDAIAEKAGVSVEDLPNLESGDLKNAIEEAEPVAADILVQHVESQRLMNETLRAEMDKGGPTWTWAWRPGWMWLLAFVWLYALILRPLTNGGVRSLHRGNRPRHPHDAHRRVHRPLHGRAFGAARYRKMARRALNDITGAGHLTEKASEMDSDLRARVVTPEHGAASKEQRLSNLEAWQRQKDIDSARHDERWKHMDDRFNRIETKLAGVNDTLTWIMRIVIGGILMGAVAFMLQGGFSPG